MNWLRENYKDVILYILVVIGMMVCVVEARAGDPCVDSGFVGFVIGDTPEGKVVIDDSNVRVASYSTTEYFFEFLPDYHRLTIPLSAMISANYSAATCSYEAEYEDDIFIDGMEE